MFNNIDLKEKIYQSTTWYTLQDLKKMNKKNKSSKLSKDKSLNKIYAFKFKGQNLYPSYLFDANGDYIKESKELLHIFKNKRPIAIAAWFSSINSWLQNKSPKDCLLSNPKEVLFAATIEAEGIQHG